MNIIDTGGFEPESQEGMLPQMRMQAEIAVEEADVIFFVVDGRAGLTPLDRQVHRFLRSSTRRIFVVVNKMDSSKQEHDAHEFYGLGVDDLYPVSAEHGVGISDLMEALAEYLPPTPEEEVDERRIRISVVGRPNAGKSTLINQLLGKDRLIVSNVAGTTRDSIDSPLDVGEGKYTLIDTVGIRRKRSVSVAVERFGVIKAIRSIERSHIVILMVDATLGLSDQDARIANLAVARGRALLIVMNKWDAVDKGPRTADEVAREIREQRSTLSYAPIVFISALTGKRSHKVLEWVNTVHENWQRRIPTAALNRWFQETVSRQPPPLYKKRPTKLYYATQARSRPPTFVLQSNVTNDSFPMAYRRFLENQLRATFEFAGAPIKLIIRQRTSKTKQE
jgi:GTP-binding protein